MSAECSTCGSDITYPDGTWPLGECSPCTRTAERDRARLTAATLANRLWQAERLLMTVIQPGTSHAQDEETGRLINIFLANGGNHHD